MAPAELINKSLINIVNYQGQDEEAGAVSLVAATQSSVQGLEVSFTLTEVQASSGHAIQPVFAGGDNGSAVIDIFAEAIPRYGRKIISTTTLVWP